MTQEPSSANRRQPPPFSAVVPAAGSGARMGARRRKPLLPLDSAPILAHTLTRLRAAQGCREIVLAVHPEDLPLFTPQVRESLEAEFGVSAVLPGGATRQQSVLAALEATSPTVPLVLIHDAVRPLVRVELIERVARQAAACGAAIAAGPCIATVKEVGDDGSVVRTHERRRLWLAQTPQGFHRELILRAHRLAAREGFTATDDAELVERLGRRVLVVQGNPENLKITTPQDLAVAETVLRWQQSRGLRGTVVREGCMAALIRSSGGQWGRRPPDAVRYGTATPVACQDHSHCLETAGPRLPLKGGGHSRGSIRVGAETSRPVKRAGWERYSPERRNAIEAPYALQEQPRETGARSAPMPAPKAQQLNGPTGPNTMRHSPWRAEGSV